MWSIRGKLKKKTQKKRQKKLKNDWSWSCRGLEVSQGIGMKFTRTSLHIPAKCFHGHSKSDVLWYGGEGCRWRWLPWLILCPATCFTVKTVDRGFSTETDIWKTTRQWKCFWRWVPYWAVAQYQTTLILSGDLYMSQGFAGELQTSLAVSRWRIYSTAHKLVFLSHLSFS